MNLKSLFDEAIRAALSKKSVKSARKGFSLFGGGGKSKPSRSSAKGGDVKMIVDENQVHTGSMQQ